MQMDVTVDCSHSAVFLWFYDITLLKTLHPVLLIYMEQLLMRSTNMHIKHTFFCLHILESCSVFALRFLCTVSK